MQEAGNIRKEEPGPGSVQCRTEDPMKQKQKLQLSSHFNYRRLIQFTLPSIGMMVIASVYSVVDGFFVSNFAGKTPFAAINLIMPFIMVLATVGFMFGTGGTALVAKTFGQGDKVLANRYFSLFVYLTFFLGILLAVAGFIWIRPIAKLLGGEGALLENAVVYGRILLISLPFNVLQLFFQPFFVTAEKPKLGLVVTVSAGVANVILDAVLVMLLPLEYKLAGAAIATAVSQLVGGGIPVLYFFSKKNTSILHLGKTRVYPRAIGQAALNGSSEFMSNISMSVVSMVYNLQLLKYAGEDGVAAYGVMMYVSMIFAATFIGYIIGIAPVIGYHDGAQNYDELKGLLRRSLILVGSFGVAMLILAEALTYPLALLFVSYDAGLMALTVEGFRIFSLSFCFMGFGIFASGFFTALNDGITSALISFLRTLVFQLGSVLLLPLVFGINGVWLAIVVAEFMAMLFGGVFIVGKRKRFHYAGAWRSHKQK